MRVPFAPFVAFSTLAFLAFASHAALAEDAMPPAPPAPPATPTPPVAPAPPAAPTQPGAIERGTLGFEPVPAALIPAMGRMQLGIPEGARVIAWNVMKGGAADVAGLKQADVLLKVAGQDLPPTKDVTEDQKTAQPFFEAWAKSESTIVAGAKVEVVVERDGKPTTLTITAAPERGYIGFTAVPVNGLSKKERARWHVTAEKGVVAIRVTKGAPAEKAGLKDGDVILKYAGQDVPPTGDATGREAAAAFSISFQQLAALTRPGKEAEIVVEREGKPVSLKPLAVSLEDMVKIRKAAGPEEEEDEGDEGDEGPEHGKEPEKAPPAPPAPPTNPQPK